MESNYDVKKSVCDYYGKTLTSSSDLQTNICCISNKTSLTPKVKEILEKIHEEILKKFYGCASHIPQGIEGSIVLDLGCGSGRDCYLASAMIGPQGKVIGIDMTDEMLNTANKFKEYQTKVFGYTEPNVEFRKGLIEDLYNTAGIEDNSIDCVISNCVINLCYEKERVYKEIWRILKTGGELYFTDIYSNRRIPDDLKSDKVLWGECLSGAMYIEDLRRIMQKFGFNYYFVVAENPIKIENPEIEKKVKGIKFFTVTVRTYKIEELEDRCEDYGEEATYLGTLGCGFEDSFIFDRSNVFKTGEKVRICRNLSFVLRNCSLFSKHFKVTESKGHLGIFKINSGVCGC